MRLEDALSGGGKLVAFIVGGDPSIEDSFNIACDVIEAGADVLEIGLPFSDPLADGPTIQAAGQRALEAGMNTDKYFNLVKRVDGRYDTPLVCLTYYNICLQYGLARFAVKCAESGIDGVIVPDLPVEEAGPFLKELQGNNVDFIFLVSETTTDDRLEKIVKKASGFIYVVSLLGTTGARKEVNPRLKGLISRIRKQTSLPLAVGFGISQPEHVRRVLDMGADAAIVGSAIVKRIEKGEDARSYVKKLKKASE
ncbi:MAG: tryptophan synthase subunit alpha [Candidatus Altiarchaeales archaeon]|nr:tryptophan synthase subunit alpha [Candidatus Altiarchaeales archaeon]MBD3415942.1 tryptophan synthase subunit alpha [Candidatus Altiarchaeales archaeon]